MTLKLNIKGLPFIRIQKHEVPLDAFRFSIDMAPPDGKRTKLFRAQYKIK
jgi:hypothetical protein